MRKVEYPQAIRKAIEALQAKERGATAQEKATLADDIVRLLAIAKRDKGPM